MVQTDDPFLSLLSRIYLNCGVLINCYRGKGKFAARYFCHSRVSLPPP